MNRVLVALTAMAFTCGIAFAEGQSGSQGGTQQQDQMGTQGGAQGGAQQQKMMGTVQSMDASAKTLTFRDTQGQTQQITVGEQAMIMKDGKEAKLSDIKQGDRVAISYTGAQANPQVKEIKVMSGKGQGGAQGGTQQDQQGSQGGTQDDTMQDGTGGSGSSGY